MGRGKTYKDAEITRFSVSIDASLIKKFDEHIKQEKCPTRSKAIADLIRDKLLNINIQSDREVAGALVFMYNHDQHLLASKLIDTQHQFGSMIISSQHVHMDNHYCMEILALRGKMSEMMNLEKKIKSFKGVQYCTLTPVSAGNIAKKTHSHKHTH
jgi:CopG family nickel-responsive transcriptional regulator